MIVYGRNPVREALRGRRQVKRVWATKHTADEEWLAGAEVNVVADDEIEHLCGSPDHQGICAEAGASESASSSVAKCFLHCRR